VDAFAALSLSGIYRISYFAMQLTGYPPSVELVSDFEGPLDGDDD
jgi:hypothetical protein